MKLSREVISLLALQAFIAFLFIGFTREYVESLRIIRLTQWFGLSAAVSIYLYLLLDTLKFSWAKHLRIPIIVFMLLHSGIAFFGEIGGLEGLSFLPHAFFIGVTIGVVGFLGVICIFTYTLFKKISQKRQRVLSIGMEGFLLLTLVHILIVGSHYLSYKSDIFRISFVAVAALLLLKVYVIDIFLSKALYSKFVPLLTMVSCVIAGTLVGRIFAANPDSLLPTINMHAESMNSDMHMQMSEQSNVSPMMVLMNSLPTMKGDRTKRYTVSFDHPEKIAPNTDTTLRFKIYDAASGTSVGLFQLAYTKLMHLVIVDQDLTFFTHIHPDQRGETFEITTQFPKDGTYHAYISFQPIGAIEQQFGFSFVVGQGLKNSKQWSPDMTLSKTFGSVEVTLSDPQLIASKMTKGEQTLHFSLKNGRTGEPVVNLSPYLAAFGHLVMINTRTYEYLHVHPTNVVAPKPDEKGGPIVEFIPMSIFDPIHPGVYRVFAQFSPNGNLFTSDFTVNVQ